MLPDVLKYSFIAAAVAAASAQAQADGYLTSGTGDPVRSAYGICWRTSAWTESRAIEECDPQLIARERPDAVAMPAPQAPQRASYSAEVLFEFERAEVSADGRKVLDDLAQKLLALELEKVTATAHADRIGGEAYNQRLSARRAEAIRVYLVEKGVPEALVHVESKGARDSITGNGCEAMGPENKQNMKLIACLQPDRRVDIEAAGREKRGG